MTEFEFTLKFTLPDITVDPDNYIEALGAQGCDDALIGIGHAGRIALDFTRESTSAFNAIASAIADVKCAVPGAKLVEATPDLVGLTDVADIVGCSRQYMRKLMLTSGSNFPMPVHEGKTALWRLSKVLDYLKQTRQYQIKDTLLDIANTNMQLNVVREAAEIEPSIMRDMHSLVL